MFNIKIKYLFYAFMFLLLFYLLMGHFNLFGSHTNEPVPMIMWWNPLTFDEGTLKTCESGNKCIFTNKRNTLDDLQLRAIIFYGSSFSPTDIPFPRSNNLIWALLNEESPRNNGILQHIPTLELFNVSATFSRFSDFPLTLLSLSSLFDIIDTKYFIHNKDNEELAPVVYVQSNCDTPCERDSYVLELMKYIPIDSYGTCLNNKKLPQELADPATGMNHIKFLKLMAKYKFTLAFENALCDDYITEKLWRPLMLGSIPIYYGSSTIQDWIPNKQSIINVRNFNSPKELAKYIIKLSNNESLYDKYLNHKLKSKIENKRLINEFKKRKWKENENFVESFECYVCDIVHNKSFHGQVTQEHYNCPVPISPITLKENKNNWWSDQWHQNKIESQVLYESVVNGEKLNNQQFYQRVAQLLLKNSG